MNAISDSTKTQVGTDTLQAGADAALKRKGGRNKIAEIPTKRHFYTGRIEKGIPVLEKEVDEQQAKRLSFRNDLPYFEVRQYKADIVTERGQDLLVAKPQN